MKLERAILTPHDYLFQATLSDVKVAEDFFREHLPEDI
jgi:hypothetical protein